MISYLAEVKEELKRVDHLLYVTLKYTRTADVLRNIIERVINAFEIGIGALLESKKAKKKIEIPSQPLKRCELAKELFPEDKELLSFIDFYLMLRRILKAPYQKREEYRRHLTMISEIAPQQFVEVSIDTIHEYYTKTKEWLAYLEGKLI